MRKLFVISALLIGATSCKNEDSDFNLPVAKLSECEEIDFSECIGFEEFTEVFPKFEKPCFNPNNSNEFVYRQGNNLWVYDLTTAESKLIRENIKALNQPDWGRSGWITFSQIDHQLWILKDDGSELKSLTSGGSHLYPEFRYGGQELLFLSTKMYLINLEGEVLDTLCAPYKDTLCSGWKNSSWSANNRLAGEYRPNQTEYGLSLYDEDGNVLKILYRSDGVNDGADFIKDIQWHPDNQRIFFTDGYGIKVVDVASKKTELIAEGCNSHGYGDISISEDGRTIIASRSTSTYADCVITTKTGIVRMNIDGSEEEELLMP